MNRLQKLQKLKLIEVVEERYVKLAESRELKSEFWNRIANKINNFGPVTKSPDEWKDVFRHMRYKVSRKITENIKLTSDELRINVLDRKVKQIRWNNRQIISSDHPTGDKSNETHSTICRICLSKTDPSELTNIFASNNDDHTNICPADKMIKLTTVVAPQLGDYLPQSICGNCLNSLEKAYCFKLVCEAGDLSLRNGTVTIDSDQKVNVSIKINDDFTGGVGFREELIDSDHLKNENIEQKRNDEVESIDNLLKEENKENPIGNIFCATLPTLEDFQKKNQLICQYCGRKFKSSKPFSKHLQIHLKREAFQCSHCPYKSTSKISIRTHVKIHVVRVQLDKPKSDCLHCGKTFLSRSNMQQHVRVVHMKLKKFQCEECGERFASRQCIRGHMVKHWKIKQFKCAICPSEYYWYSGIKKHMTKCHPGVTFLTELQYQRLNSKNI